MAVILFCDALHFFFKMQMRFATLFMHCLMMAAMEFHRADQNPISWYEDIEHVHLSWITANPYYLPFFNLKRFGHPHLGWPNSGCSFCLLLTSNSGLQIQLIRIELRVPEYGWTTQKVFHLLNFIVNGGELQWPLFCRHSSLLHACSKIGFSLMFFRLLAWHSASCRLFTAE